MNYKLIIQYVLTSLIIIIFITCSVKKDIKQSSLTFIPQTKEIFISNPFGYEPSIKNFSKHLPSYKLQIYTTKNRYNPSVTDSIFRFYRKKSEFFIYKTRMGRELFVAANIYDDKIIFQNGIKVGINRSDFSRCFTNFSPNIKDTVRMTSRKAGNSYYFIFKGGKLDVIKIDNYID